jgi:hypothetical protein
MAVTEDRRHELYKGLEDLMDTQRATTLMELLPPVGWADVATKHDLDHLSETMGKEFALVRGQIREAASGLRAEWERSLRVFFFAQLGAGIALASLVVAAIKLI